MSIRLLFRKVNHFLDTFEAYIHLFYSFILIIFATGLLWVFYYTPLISLYHDLTWLDSTAKINKVEYAYRGYTENFETIHPAKNIDELKSVNGKNTFFIFINYDYQFKDKSLLGNYQFDNMGEETGEKFFERIKGLKEGSSLDLKINPDDETINVPKRETKLNGKEDNLLIPFLWILFFYIVATFYIRDFIKHTRKKKNIR